MKVSTILGLAALLASASLTSAATCDGPQPGQVCLADCKGNGFFVTAPQLIDKIELGPTFQLDFDASGNPLASSKGVKVGLSLPESLKNVDLSFSAAKARIGVGAPGGASVGLLSMPEFLPASGTSLNGQVELDMDKVNFTALNEDGFKQLFRAITVADGPIQLELQGHAGNKATVRNADEQAAGDDPEVCLEYVGFTAGSQLIGLGGLKQAEITGLPIMKGGNPATGIELEIPLKVVNPSNVILNLGSDVVLDLTYNGQKCGTVVLPNMSLQLGENNFKAKSFVFPDKTNIRALVATKELMSRFTGKTVSDVVVNNGRAAKAPVLDDALGALSIAQKLPANQENLINGSVADISTLSYTSSAETSFSMMASINAYNPFDAPVSITNIKSTLAYKSKDCITSNTDVSGFNLPPKGTAASPGFKVTLDGSVDPYLCGAELVVGTLTNQDVRVDVKSTLTLDIGGYQSQIDYVQPNIAVKSTATPCTGKDEKAYCLSDCTHGDGIQLPMPIPLIKNINLPNFKLDFDPNNNPDLPKATSTGVKVELDVPGWLSFIDFQFEGAGASIAVGAPGGPLVAQIDTPDYEKATGSIKEKGVGLNIEQKDFKPLTKEGMEALLKFITLNSGPTPVRMKGRANNKAKFPAPFNRDVCLRYINFDVVSTSLIGLGGLKDTKITGLPVIKSGNPVKGIELQVPLTITNPSNIELNTRTDITMDLQFEGQTVGTVVLPKFVLGPGANNILATSYVHPDPKNIPQLLATKKMFSQFSGGVASNVVVGKGKAEGLPLLDQALEALSIPQVLPANQEKLIISSKADGNKLAFPETYPDTGEVNDGSYVTMEATLTSFNPFDVPVMIVQVNAKLLYKGKVCVEVNAPVQGFVIPPKQSVVSPSIPIVIDSRGDRFDTCQEFVSLQLSGAESFLDVQSTLTLVIDKYPSQIDYVQSAVSVKTAFE
ncbi:hypothetical protein HDU67_007629 [Dinochytrium kinnereticum]|nr:hypothetical protein HDU67_007629 [Dinochytrium kinnereticum]